MKQEYQVEAIITSRHLFTTFAHSPEGACAEIEGMIEDGERGEIISQEIETMDAYPAEDVDEMDEDDDN